MPPFLFWATVSARRAAVKRGLAAGAPGPRHALPQVAEARLKQPGNKRCIWKEMPRRSPISGLGQMLGVEKRIIAVAAPRTGKVAPSCRPERFPGPGCWLGDAGSSSLRGWFCQVPRVRPRRHRGASQQQEDCEGDRSGRAWRRRATLVVLMPQGWARPDPRSLGEREQCLGSARRGRPQLQTQFPGVVGGLDVQRCHRLSRKVPGLDLHCGCRGGLGVGGQVAAGEGRVGSVMALLSRPTYPTCNQFLGRLRGCAEYRCEHARTRRLERPERVSRRRRSRSSRPRGSGLDQA